MSRSYRKNPIIKARGFGGKGKTYANRRVRRTKDIPNGKEYCKYYPTWDVIDHWSHFTLQECIDRWHSWKAEGRRRWYLQNKNSLEEEIEWWYKTFYWK